MSNAVDEIKQEINEFAALVDRERHVIRPEDKLYYEVILFMIGDKAHEYKRTDAIIWGCIGFWRDQHPKEAAEIAALIPGDPDAARAAIHHLMRACGSGLDE
jgi:hypothetical protein